MRLIYRGIIYEANFPTMEVNQTEQIGHYRSAPLAGKRLDVSQPRLAPTYLKYCGVDYSNC
ncbi:MAG: DUF4278 domain-containing protein [Pseudanabaenales cyanobacterium]|nr:DUF4278 domain-containing protein [Pseudanabaenales cyanobacterium]